MLNVVLGFVHIFTGHTDLLNVYRCSVYMYTHTYMLEYYSPVRKKDNQPFVTTRVDLEGIMLSKVS